MGEYLRFIHSWRIINDNEKLKALDTGLFLSNIHYLNWSDNLGVNYRFNPICMLLGRERRNGCSNQTMRFDDSFYNFFGDNLEAVGSKVLGRPVIDHEVKSGRN